MNNKAHITLNRSNQSGVSTLVISIMLLVIISLIVLFSTNVGYFEQRTASNENRARIAEQAAEVAINMGGEYIKANRDYIISKDTAGATKGWLSGTASVAGWKTCASTGATLGGKPHPCRSEQNSTRRDELWFYTTDGTGSSIATTLVPYGAVGNVGGGASFSSVVNLQAVLCRIDSSLTVPACVKNPASGNRIAVTLISDATLANENSTAVIKETWASFTGNSPSASVPLMASGIIKGLGNSQVVANPNAGGYGIPGSMWSPNNIGFGTKNTNTCTDGSDNGAGGLGSSSTCQIEDYLFGTTFNESTFKTGCAANGAKCGCPNIDGRYMSGHVAGDKAEGIDVLDADGNNGPLPDIAFYPGTDCKGVEMDDPADPTDDSLFEWVFNADVVTEGTKTTKNTLSVNQNCGPSTNQDCAVYYLLNDLSATPVTCAALNALGTNATGIYYVSATCSITSVLGSATQPVIVVLEQGADVKANIYGMLFVRSKNNTADVQISGNNKIFGSMIIEGDIKVTGTIDIVYDNTGINSDPNTFPKSAKFARVPGSWLDATKGF